MSNLKQILPRLLPVVIFLMLLAFLYRGLSLDPHALPSPFIGKPAPKIDLPLLHSPDKHLNNANFRGHVSLLNVWATWCGACRVEHPFLLKLARQKRIPIYGLDYKDNRQAAFQWLKTYGDPYQHIAFDRLGTTAINWGVYGTPETFIIDKDGIIRYKQIGPMNETIWKEKMMPVIKRYS